MFTVRAKAALALWRFSRVRRRPLAALAVAALLLSHCSCGFDASAPEEAWRAPVAGQTVALPSIRGDLGNQPPRRASFNDSSVIVERLPPRPVLRFDQRGPRDGSLPPTVRRYRRMIGDHPDDPPA